MKFDVEHPNWRLPYLQDASNLPSSNIPSIRWYNMHQTMLIWKGEGRAKAVDLDSKHFFSGQMPYPSDIIFGQKRTNSPSLQLRLEVKCVSLKVATYQHLEKTSSALKCCLYINKLTSFVN